MASSELEPDVVVEPGGQRYFELGKPLLSLSRPGDVRGCAGQMRATRERGQPK